MEWGCLAFYLAEMAAKLLALGAVRVHFIFVLYTLCLAAMPPAVARAARAGFGCMAACWAGLPPQAAGRCTAHACVRPARCCFTLHPHLPCTLQWAQPGCSYFRSAWNWLDFTIVCTSLLASVLSGTGWVAALRLLRVLRPLRLIARSTQMKVGSRWEATEAGPG
jgi:hypothetical protein